MVVDSKGGAGGTIGAAEPALAPSDGSTFRLSNSAPMAISLFMLDEPPYDPATRFNHISYIGLVANVFVLDPSVLAKAVKGLLAWTKSQK